MLNRRKVLVKDLEIGMYVAELDKPWEDTPFLFQGLHIKTIGDINKLQNICDFVYIDEEKCSHPGQRFGGHNTNIVQISQGNGIQDQAPVHPSNPLFKSQIRQALEVHNSAHAHIKNMMNSVYEGKTPDISQAKSVVNQLAESVIQNPTALVWLTHLKHRDEYTSIHSLNVCILALCFGRYTGLEHAELSELGLGAMLHDIGKLRVPLEVLNKPGKLTEQEFSIIKQHTVFGYELMQNEEGITGNMLNIIKYHHERLDGQGYPSRLAEEGIDFFTRIVSIVDVYDAITSSRAYKEAAASHDAVGFLYSQKDRQFDRDLVEKFIKYLGVYPIGTTVELTTGEIGVVVADNKQNQLLPIVLLVLDKDFNPFPSGKYINLANPGWLEEETRPWVEKVVNPAKYGLDITRIVQHESEFLAGKKVHKKDPAA